MMPERINKMTLLKIENLSVWFRTNDNNADVKAVDNISYELEAGEVLGIVGESGSGKSVSALSILGLLPYPKAYHSKQSSVKFMGKELLNASEKELRKVRGNDIAFIFQEPMSSLNPLHTVEKQISETLILHRGMNEKQAKKEVLRLLKVTGIKKARERMKAYPFELSGGQRQRVMIAMAVANNPKVLIADEPTTALDVTIQAQILDLLMELKDKLNMAIIFISHDLRVIQKIASKVCVMKDGKIVEQGDVNKVFNAPENSYTKTLIDAHSELKINNNISNNPVLELKDVVVKFPIKKNFWGKVIDEIRAVDNVSFTLRQGETLGIVGESGSGKTTLGMSIVDLVKYDGKIVFNNIVDNQRDKCKNECFRKSVQVVFQDPYNSLNPRMNIEQIVGEGLEVHFSELSKDEKRMRIINMLKEVGLSENVLSKYPHEFSGGQRQRIAIARALVLEPKLLVLDEPTSALDVTIQAQIIALLQNIQQKMGLSYIFISHDMKAVRAMSDRIAVMKDGKIIEISDRDMIFNYPKEEYTKRLIAASM